MLLWIGREDSRKMLDMFRDSKETRLASIVGSMQTEVGTVIREVIGVRKQMCRALYTIFQVFGFFPK